MSFQGTGVSPGIARAIAVVRLFSFEKPETYAISLSDIPSEKERLERALVETRQQILTLQEKIQGSSGSEDASIFDAHLLVLEDHAMLQQVFSKMEVEKINVESALYQVLVGYLERLQSVGDPYLSERAIDVKDVARRILRNLRPSEPTDKPAEAAIKHPHVLITMDLTPSDTAGINRDIVRGFVTEMGSQTSHTAIMARSLNLPAIVGLHGICSYVSTGDDLLLDGYNGKLIVNPREETIAEYEALESRKIQLRQSLWQIKDQPAVTKDGFRVTLSGNIEFATEMANVRELGGEGVGLYRTEFSYMDRPTLPSEKELADDYCRAASEAAPHGVIIRTLDAGGDKLPGTTHLVTEPNPFLGWRGIRVCLEEEEIFQTQLRAILRASHQGKVSIMFPIVSGVQELRAAKQQLEKAKQSLRSLGVPFDESVPVGVMIEVPSAAIMADALAAESDFFSFGTNDLIQYTIAVDRVNERVAGLYSPYHPAILRLLKMATEAAHKHGIWVGVCGEMAGDVISTPLLVGLGITELSVGSSQLLSVKKAVRSLDHGECATLVEDLVEAELPEEIAARCREMAMASYPELLS